MLDHDHRLARIHQPVQQSEQLLDISQVQARGRLVEDQRIGLVSPGVAEARSELEPLPLTAGQGGQRLPERQVTQPHIGHPRQDLLCGRYFRFAFAEVPLRLTDGHGQDLGDVASAEGVLQHRCAEPLALTLLARGLDGGHHPEVGVDHPGAVARRTGALRVRAEQCRFDVVGLRECLTDRVEQPGVGGRVTAARAADRALIDHHHAVPAGHRAVDQRTLARARDTGDHHQRAQRDVDVHIAQIVGVGPADLHGAVGLPHRILQPGAVAQVVARDGVAGPQVRHAALEDHLAPG